jgi:hypothetical protein
MPLAPLVSTQYEYKGPICGCEYLVTQPQFPENRFEEPTTFQYVVFGALVVVAIFTVVGMIVFVAFAAGLL